MTTVVTPNEYVASEVRAMMAKRRVRVNHLPRILGKSQSYWERRVNGPVPFDADDLAKIAKVLEVKVSRFFDQLPIG
jgi:hypothetical protein